jgi:phosphoglycerate dehydrogenase-like enzyme
MKAFITAEFHPKGVELLEPFMEVHCEGWRSTGKIYFDGEEFAAKINEVAADVLIVEADLVHEEVLSLCPLKIIGCCRGDPLNVLSDIATEKGIPVFYTPGRNADAVADLTLAFMLCLARNIVQISTLLKSGTVHFESEKDILDVYNRYGGFELGGCTVGLLGLGAVGRKVAQRLKPFGPRVIVHDPYASREVLEELQLEQVSLERLVEDSDILSLHAALTDETHRIIGRSLIERMKPTSMLVNTARSFLVDEEALLEALRHRRIAGAALDVLDEEPVQEDNPFLELDNVIVTPHIGGATRDVVRHQSEMIASDIVRYLTGERPEHIVNPEVLERRRGERQ